MEGAISYAVAIILSVVANVVFLALLWFRQNLLVHAERAQHFLQAHASRRPWILVWVDDDFPQTRKLAASLQEKVPGARIAPLRTPMSVLRYPLTRKATQAIVLVNCDVTKLSSDAHRSLRVQQHLVDYVCSGGGLIGTHDIIYRRVRNELLEEVFGCRLTHFSRQEKPVTYRVTQEASEHPLTSHLPSTFCLNDAEYMWGTWAPDVQIIFETGDKESKPVVTTRRYASGKVVWMNSGDKQDYLPPSVLIPEDPFVQLLVNAVKWVS